VALLNKAESSPVFFGEDATYTRSILEKIYGMVFKRSEIEHHKRNCKACGCEDCFLRPARTGKPQRWLWITFHVITHPKHQWKEIWMYFLSKLHTNISSHLKFLTKIFFFSIFGSLIF